MSKEDIVMERDNLTDYDLLLFERLHTKALQKIIDVKNKQLKALSEELKLVHSGIFEDVEPVVSVKDSNRVKYIIEIEARLKYFKARYNSLLTNLRK